MSEQELELPKGWVEECITEVFYHVPTGVNVFEGFKDYYSTGSIKKPKIIPEGNVNFKNKPDRANRLAKKNDVFQARMEYSEKSVLINDDLDDSLFSTGFLQFRTLAECSPKYLFYLLHSPIFLTQRDKYSTGSTQKALTDGGLRKIIVPLAPLNEQARIVLKIEQLLPKIDSNLQLLMHTQIKLIQYRFSILKSAFEGNLTKEWRLKNNKIEDPKTTFDKITNNNKKFSSKYELVNMNVPKTWITCFLGQIFEIKSGIQKQPKRKPIKNFYPYLRVGNVYKNKLDLETIEYFEITENELELYRLKKGDLLVVEGNGSVDQIGRSAIWNNEINDCIHQNHIIRCRPMDKINSIFFSYYLSSAFGRTLLKEIAKSTSGLFTLSTGKLSSISIPFPAPEEQNEIVFQIEKYFLLLQNFQNDLNSTLNNLFKFRMSILKQAFMGKLVPQDPNDESAEKLLIKIKNNNHTKKRRAKNVK